ncbi:MAG: ATP-binding protein [Elainella sp.]
MVNNLFTPPGLIGRASELQQITRILADDGDFSLVGAPGIGRRTLIYAAAQQIGARVIELDCLRITNAQRLLRLLASGLLQIFAQPEELGLIQRWSLKQAVVLEQSAAGPRLVWSEAPDQEWSVFQALLALPQIMAESLDCRVVVLFLNFPHLRSWDRSGQWEAHLRQEIQQQNRVSYALVSTVVEPWIQQSQLPVIFLAPLADTVIANWLISTMAAEGFEFSQEALHLFTANVQGHLGDAIALARRIWLDQRALSDFQPCLLEAQSPPNHKPDALPTYQIEAHHVHRSTLALVDDLSVTFESLILLLPPSQVRVLESLALDPTDKPQSRDYIQKHQLSRGGSLQGALSSLEQKGLLYGPEKAYRVALPFLTFWLRQRLS